MVVGAVVDLGDELCRSDVLGAVVPVGGGLLVGEGVVGPVGAVVEVVGDDEC